MKKTTVGSQPGILVDVCREGEGLWFDGGEVAKLIRQLVAEPSGRQASQQPILNFLGEVFNA
jgi:Zn-finger nucleic acid-binding protein